MGLQYLSKAQLIAPCGMNCTICSAFLREKNKCSGCRGNDDAKPMSCTQCIIRNCKILKEKNLKFCSPKCSKFPCQRLFNLDKRYSTKYNMSMIENLKNIEKLGIRKFTQNEQSRWACKKCAGTINVHKKICSKCNKKV